MSKDLQLIYKDVPLSQLLETDITKLSEDELRAYAQVLQQRRAVPGVKRSTKTKLSKIEAGTVTKISLSGFADDE
jgi:hypothetical protein